jgi:hypothetical protein
VSHLANFKIVQVYSVKEAFLFFWHYSGLGYPINSSKEYPKMIVSDWSIIMIGPSGGTLILSRFIL